MFYRYVNILVLRKREMYTEIEIVYGHTRIGVKPEYSSQARVLGFNLSSDTELLKLLGFEPIAREICNSSSPPE